MKIIAVIGDSHTWGQGVGADYHMDPPTCLADLRPLPFAYPTYVNLLRDSVNLVTGSSARTTDEATRIMTGHTEQGCAVLEKGKPLTTQSDFDFARIFFRAEPTAAEVTVTLDGEIIDVISLQSDAPLTNDGMEVCHVFPKTDGVQHELTLTVTGGERVLIFRQEEYCGAYAVVNCGVGSTTAAQYAQRYFDRFVMPLQPHAVLFEGCTINDWLQVPTSEVYADELRLMLDKIRTLTDRQLWHTVFPVWGEQMNQWGVAYAEYVNTMRALAENAGIPLVDAFAYMEKELNAVPEELKYRLLYSDGWHPNGTGHYMYAHAILPALRKML